MTFPVHPAAELFPMMTEAELDGLINDISENGLDEPIELDTDGNLIDGRNRALACEKLGISPARKIYTGNDVWKHVISRNLHRRHLNESQRAMVAAKLAARPVGHPPISPIGEIDPVPTHKDAAKALGVGGSSVSRAKTIITKGTPSLQQLVTDGKATVNAAATVANLPADEQDAIVEKVLAGESIKKLTPKATPSQRPKSPPKYGGNRRKLLAVIEAITNSIAGAVLALEGVDDLDASITAEEATRLTRDLSIQIKTLQRINNLIKERNS